MFRKNNSRQNNRSSAQKQGSPGHRGGGQPKSVSPNYRVDLMAHTFTPQTGGGAQSYGPRQGSAGFGNQPARPQQPRHQQPRPQQQHQQPRPQHQQPRPQHAPPRPPARKGYTNITVEVRDDLLAAFKEKTAGDGKTGNEVINQLIDFYNMGKVTV